MLDAAFVRWGQPLVTGWCWPLWIFRSVHTLALNFFADILLSMTVWTRLHASSESSLYSVPRTSSLHVRISAIAFLGTPISPVWCQSYHAQKASTLSGYAALHSEKGRTRRKRARSRSAGRKSGHVRRARDAFVALVSSIRRESHAQSAASYVHGHAQASFARSLRHSFIALDRSILGVQYSLTCDEQSVRPVDIPTCSIGSITGAHAQDVCWPSLTTPTLEQGR